MRKLLALLLAGMLALTGCAQSKPAEDDILTEKSVMITIYPDGRECRSEDNGITWSCDGENVVLPDAYLTMRTLEPLTFEMLHQVTLHNNNNFESMQICRAYDLELERLSDGEWVYAKQKNENALFFPIGHEILDEEAVDLWLCLSAYEQITGRYRARIPYEGYTFIAEFTVIAE